MSLYLKNIPFFIKWIYPEAKWCVKTNEKVLYLTFDDGPVEGVTNWVLKTLEEYNAKATFFCVGQNVNINPNLFRELTESGHSIGNHSYHHLKGLNTGNKLYLQDVGKADNIIKSRLFRPPYGLMGYRQYIELKHKFDIVMWDVLSGDFDTGIDGEKCYQNVVKNAKQGSIVVFHDSKKAFPRLKIALPKILKYYSELGYRFERI
ncbi:MAG: polysaccharide deacetylase family protein [Bacteroidota bacterium]